MCRGVASKVTAAGRRLGVNDRPPAHPALGRPGNQKGGELRDEELGLELIRLLFARRWDAIVDAHTGFTAAFASVVTWEVTACPVVCKRRR